MNQVETPSKERVSQHAEPFAALPATDDPIDDLEQLAQGLPRIRHRQPRTGPAAAENAQRLGSSMQSADRRFNLGVRALFSGLATAGDA